MSQEQPSYDDRLREQRAQMGDEMATNVAMNASKWQREKVHMNPDFFEKFRDAGVDSEKHDWVAAELGPVFAGVRPIANRSEEHEQVRELLNRNGAERKVTEHTPGRLIKSHPHSDALMQISQGVHGRSDKTAQEPFVSEDRRVIRDAYDAATDFHSQAVEGEGLHSMTDITAVNKREGEKEEQSSAEKFTSRIFG